MTRAIFDPNVLIAAAIAPNGPPADCLRTHANGGFELIVSEHLLSELIAVLSRDKFRRYLSLAQVARLVAALRRDAILGEDPREAPPVPSPDPKDDYLLALAHSRSAGACHRRRPSPRQSACSSHHLAPRDFLLLLPSPVALPSIETMSVWPRHHGPPERSRGHSGGPRNVLPVVVPAVVLNALE